MNILGRRRAPSCTMRNPWVDPPKSVWDAPEFPDYLERFNEREGTSFTLEQLKDSHASLVARPWEALKIPFKPIDIACYKSRAAAFRDTENTIDLRFRFSEGMWMPLVIYTGDHYALFDGIRRVGIAQVSSVPVVAAVLDPLGAASE